MSPHDEQPPTPDVDQLARSMLRLYGAHDDHHSHGPGAGGASRPNASAFSSDPRRAEAVRQATERDRQRYLTSGLQPVDCRYCHVSVLVKKLGPGKTSVQWNSVATERCAYFAEVRAAGGLTACSRACPKMTDSIDHAIAEGVLDPVSTAPPPGDGWS